MPRQPGPSGRRGPTSQYLSGRSAYETIYPLFPRLRPGSGGGGLSHPRAVPLPHSPGLFLMFSVLGLNHKNSYRHVFACSVCIPVLVVVVATAICVFAGI